MGMDLAPYIKVSEKRYDFVPGNGGIRATTEVRRVLNKVLEVDFKKADTEHYSWEGEALKEAFFKLNGQASFHILDGSIDTYAYKAVVNLFRECLQNGYTVSLV